VSRWRGRGDGDRTAPSADQDAEPGCGSGAVGADVQIVLAVPSRARIAGAAVVSEGSGVPGGVPLIALWEDATFGGEGVADTGEESAAGSAGGRTSGRDRADPPPAPWATRRARRAAIEVRRAGVEAVATGNSVRVELPADETQAVAGVERVAALSDRGPVVCVVSRPWGSGWLRMIERAGAVRVAGPTESIEASRTMLRRHGVTVRETPAPTGAVAAMLLRAGWTARALIRGAAEAAAEEPWRDHGATGRGGAAAGARRRGAFDDDSGQALLLILLGLTVALVLAGVLGAVAMAMSGREDQQRAVDVAALAAAAQLRAGSSFAVGSGSNGERVTGPGVVRTRAVAVARSTARENGVATVQVDFPNDGSTGAAVAALGDDGARSVGIAGSRRGSTADVVPQRVRVRSAHRPVVAGVVLSSEVAATAEVATPRYAEAVATGDEYAGPLAMRQGKPMRPDVALAFDRMNAAATAAGQPLSVTSGYRSNAEQARLFAAHPDPKWVARPGTSLHRMGTELDLGPPSAYGWLAANSRRFGFLKRYSWEPWHFGFIRETASAHVAEQGRNPEAPQTNGTIPPWVPAAYRDRIRAASIRFKVSAALLSAQLKAESNFNPRVVSSAGAQGIAQFMPGTAAGVGLKDPFDPAQAIPAQARLMAGLLRRFGSVPLALAAYNAGEGRVGVCHCIPPYPETQHYVARIIALMKGYDDGVDGAGLAIRLVE